MKRSAVPLYQDRPKYDVWLKLVVGGTLAITIIPGIAFFYLSAELAWTMLALTVFDGLLFYAIIPRRLQLFEDRLRIVLGAPFALSVRYENIKEVRTAPTEEVFVYWGLRFATSTKNPIEIVKSKGLNMIISPGDKDIFMEQLEQARNTRSSIEKGLGTEA
jgi:hypothetical protein